MQKEIHFYTYQPGIPRTATDILAELKIQVKMVCRGVAQPIIDRQADSGVKDAYTQYWINQLIECVCDMKKRDCSLSTDSIAEELLTWVAVNEARIYNPFLSHPGPYWHFLLTLHWWDITDNHSRLRSGNRHTNRDFTHYPPWHSSHTSWSDAQKKTYTL